MGKLTKHYRLYKPSINETDWGEEVNQNFDIIDVFLRYLEKSINELYSFHNRLINRLEIDVIRAEKEFNTYGEELKSFYDVNLQDVNKYAENVQAALDINLQDVNKLSENLTVEVNYEFVN